MESDGFNGLAVFIVLAVITGVMCYLAVMQSRVKKQIEESRRERESAELATLGTTFIPTAATTPPPDITSLITPGPVSDATPTSLPIITPGGTPPPDPGGHHHGGDHPSTPPATDGGGTWSSGSGFDSGSGGGHGGHH